jgi:hypothetical protein
MDVLDLFFKKYSYKFPKGYPDMNNHQDVLLLESILKELGVNLDEAFEDSPNLPSDISNLKDNIESDYDTFKIEAAQKKGGGNYFLYFKEVSPRDREKRKEILQDLINNGILSKDSEIKGGGEEGYYASTTINGNKYKIWVKGSGGKFTTDTDIKEGLVVLLYNSSIEEPFTKENFQSNFDKLKEASFEGISTIENKLKSYLNIFDENIDTASKSKAALDALNDPLSSALTIKKAYPGKKIIRDGAFNTIRQLGAQTTGIDADKWNPGDVYLQISEPEIPSLDSLKKDPTPWAKLNALFVNDWGNSDAPLVSISLKQERAQAGKAKGFLKKFQPSSVEGTQKEYNLTDDEMKWTPEQYNEGINTIKEKFKSRFAEGNPSVEYKFDKNPSQPNQLRAKYSAYKSLDYLLDHFKQEEDVSAVSALAGLAAYGMSVSGVNPTFFKITGNSSGNPTTPSKFPAGAASRLTPGTKITIDDRPTNGEIGISISIDIMKGNEVIDTKKLTVVARNNGGKQGTIDLKPGK